MAVAVLAHERVSRAKRAFTTRRVAVGEMQTLISGSVKPSAGDLVMARVDVLGKHRRIELPDGRRANMFPGDEIVVCFGNRYAPDQFEAVIGGDLGACDLVAGGGIAACEVSRHDRVSEPTRITPIGLVGDGAGKKLNLRDFALPRHDAIVAPAIVAVLSVGTSMNAGKTLAATSMLHGLRAAGFRVAGIKATGTGSGGDLWIMQDAGANLVLDFTDAGFASTYLAPTADLEAATLRLISQAAASGCDVAVIEIADGLQQLETSALIRSEPIRRAVAGVVFSAYDAMGAKCGVDTLRAAGHRVIALSGRLAQSPLGIREAEIATGLPVYTPWELQAGVLVEQIMALGAGELAEPMSCPPHSGAAGPARIDEIADVPSGGISRTKGMTMIDLCAERARFALLRKATMRIAILRAFLATERVIPLHFNGLLNGLRSTKRPTEYLRDIRRTSMDLFHQFKRASNRLASPRLQANGIGTIEPGAHQSSRPGVLGKFVAGLGLPGTGNAQPRLPMPENEASAGLRAEPEELDLRGGRLSQFSPSPGESATRDNVLVRYGPVWLGDDDSKEDLVRADGAFATTAPGDDEDNPTDDWAIPRARHSGALGDAEASRVAATRASA